MSVLRLTTVLSTPPALSLALSPLPIQFRSISLGLVTEQDMAGNAPDPALAARTQPATFGQVDAFLTYSWSDDSGLKWQQLQQWRTAFKAKHNGREPLMWIDKVIGYLNRVIFFKFK